MGYLINDGITFEYPESVKYQERIKKDGIIQFLNIYKNYQNYTLKDQLSETQHKNTILWGDEVESHVLHIDEENKEVKAVNDLSYLFDSHKENYNDLDYTLQPEQCCYMIETTPKNPYCSLTDLSATLANMDKRTEDIMKRLKKGQHIYTSPVVVLFGKSDFKLHDSNNDDDDDDDNQFTNDITKSKFIDDRFVTNHPRYQSLSRNIYQRIQKSQEIKIPVYPDLNTNYQVTEDEPFPGYIYSDTPVYGPGAAGLQATFAAKDFQHARRLYDQMSVLCPLLLSLTAGSSIFKGKLASNDTKWDVISQSMDDRTQAEKDPSSENYMPSSRWGPVYQYISDESRNLDSYNDAQSFPQNQQMSDFIQQKCREMNTELDEKIVSHLKFLFQRDSLIMFKDKINANNKKETCHFENLQSTNWNSMRLKPPPSLNSQIGWRVEFRTMDQQINNQENAAFINFVYIFARLFYQSDDLNFYIPITKVHENFNRAKQMNSAVNQKYYFRTNVLSPDAPVIEELTINEIFFGKDGVFEGLYYFAYEIWSQFIEGLDLADQNYLDFEKTFEFIRQKSCGERKTLAVWMREFVLNHGKYKKDSIVCNEIGFDLMQRITQIHQGLVQDPNFNDVY